MYRPTKTEVTTAQPCNPDRSHRLLRTIPQVFLESASLEETTAFFTSSLNKFLVAEMQFQDLEESAAVSALAKV
jgi:hypothetical protein